MSDKLEKNLKHASEEFCEVLNDIEDQLDDLAEDSNNLWQRVRTLIEKVGRNLSEEAKIIEKNHDEIRLHTHLALMETHKRADAAHEALSAFILKSRNKSRHMIDHAQLQAHLARMEARDFAQEAKSELSSELKTDGSKLHAASLKASEQIKVLSTRLRNRFSKHSS